MNYSTYLESEKQPSRKDLKIGIAIPCHVDDNDWLATCLQSVQNLNPEPYTYMVNLNNGEGGLKTIRTNLFDNLFEKGCDVVLSCDVDFFLFPDILKYIRSDKAVSFCWLQGRPIDALQVILRRLTRKPWAGCYSLPKHIWETVKKSNTWDGSDGSVSRIVGDYDFIHSPKLYLMRRSDETISFGLSRKGIFQKVKWMAFHAW